MLAVICRFCDRSMLEQLVQSCCLSTEFVLHEGCGELRLDHNYARSPHTIIAVLPLFYLTCRCVPSPPIFQRVNIEKLGKGLGTRLVCTLESSNNCFCSCIYTCNLCGLYLLCIYQVLNSPCSPEAYKISYIHQNLIRSSSSRLRQAKEAGKELQ